MFVCRSLLLSLSEESLRLFQSSSEKRFSFFLFAFVLCFFFWFWWIQILPSIVCIPTCAVFPKKPLQEFSRKAIILYLQSQICPLLNGGHFSTEFKTKKKDSRILYDVVVILDFLLSIRRERERHHSAFTQRPVVFHHPTLTVTLKRHMCAKDMRPFEIVSESGFEHFCQNLLDISRKDKDHIDALISSSWSNDNFKTNSINGRRWEKANVQRLLWISSFWKDEDLPLDNCLRFSEA